MRILFLILLLFSFQANLAFCQSSALTLASGSGQPGSTVPLNLTLSNASGQPSGVQFTLVYNASDFSTITVTAGSAATAAGKSLSCQPSTGQLLCLVWGINATTLGNGTIAVVNATLGTGSVNVTRPIQVTGAVAAAADGTSLAITATGGAVLIPAPALTVSALTCAPGLLNPGGTASCSVQLSALAPSGGAIVTLSSSNTVLAVPASVNVAAGQSTASFTATAGTITVDSAATVTATFGGTSRTATVNLVSPAILTALACSPATLNSGGTASCTATLSKAATATIAVASNNASLAVPVSVTAAGQATASFTATAGAIALDSTATITASLNGSSRTAAVSLVSPPAALTALACSPATLNSGGTASCTATLSKAVSAATSITISDNSAALTVPASVSVAAGQSTGLFTATAGTLTANSTAIVTATLNGGSQNATINLVAPAQNLNLTLSSGTGQPGSNVALNLTLANTAAAGQPSGLQFTLVYNTSDFSTVNVTAGAVITAAGKSLTCNTPAAGQLKCLIWGANSITMSDGVIGIANVTPATGSVNTTRPIQLTGAIATTVDSSSLGINSTGGAVQVAAPPITLSSLTCTPTTVSPSAASTCSLQLSSAAPAGGTSVALSSSNPTLSVPATITVAAGQSSGSFTATAGAFTADGTATVTASLNGSSRTSNISLTAPAALTALNCSPSTLNAAGPVTCTITLSKAVSAAAAVAISDNSSSVTVPASVSIASGSASAQFTATASSVTAQTSVQIVAAYNGVFRPTTIVLQPPSLSTLQSLTCTPSTISNGQSTRCTVTLTAASPIDQNITLRSSSSTTLSVPSTVQIRTGQTSVDFMGQAIRNRGTMITITATLNSTSTQAMVLLVMTSSSTLSISGRRASFDGEPIHLVVSGNDPQELPLALSASELPSGASFNPNTGEFLWEPVNAKSGDYTINFQATNGSGQTSQAKAVLHVGSSEPVLEKLIHSATRSDKLACSAGSLATITGDGLETRRSGESMRVSINGEFAPVIASNGTEITFQCPALPTGSILQIQAHRGSRLSNVLESVMGDAAPGIFSVDGTGTGQGLISLSAFNRIAMLRLPDELGQPATRSDLISVMATGIGEATNQIEAFVGDQLTPVESIMSVAPGLWQVMIRIPEQTPLADAVPVKLTVRLPDGRNPSSNVVTFATEARDLATQ